MAWLEGYNRRALINVRTSAGSPAAGHAQFDVPDTWDDFWDAIDSSGEGVRVTRADGVKLMFDPAWGLNSTTAFSKANKEGTLCFGSFDVDSVAIIGSGQNVPGVFWLYYDPDTVDPFVTNPTITANVYDVSLVQVAPGVPVFTAGATSPGTTTPADEVGKKTAEEVRIWWDITGLLDRSDTTANDRTEFEEWRELRFDVETGGASQASMLDLADNCFAEQNGRHYAVTTVKAGTTATDYTAILTVDTTAPHLSNAARRTLEYRALVKVNDPDET